MTSHFIWYRKSVIGDIVTLEQQKIIFQEFKSYFAMLQGVKETTAWDNSGDIKISDKSDD